MKILLLDMDGVLLHPNGYHEALQDNVRMWGRALSFNDARLSRETIFRFESAGVSAEWVSGSMCLALMQLALWELDPALPILESLASPLPLHDLPTPDFSAFTRQLVAASDHQQAVESGIRLLEARCSRAEQALQLRSLVEAATDFERSPFHRAQQELVLGSEQMQVLYGVKPQLNTPGYLLTRDRPAVSARMIAQLQAWLAAEDHVAVVMTNRPSRSPDGSGSPEAELGLQLLGLEEIPLIGMGQIGWLAGQMACPLEALLKPHAAHALAAIRRALGTNPEEDLEAVHQFLTDGQARGWDLLNGADVVVLEDSANGCLSAIAAVDRLARAGIKLRLFLHGIAPSPEKRQALEAHGVRLFDAADDALSAALDSK